MKRKFVWIPIFVMIGAALFVLIAPRPKPKDVPKEMLLLPSIDLLLTDSQTVINTSDAPKGKATVLFYFDPGCEHCQLETEDIIANKTILKSVNFYFISLDSMRRIKSFTQHYRLKELPGIVVTKDYQYKALSTLRIKAIPTNIVYNEEHEIAKIVTGGMSVNELTKFLEND